MNDDLDEDDRDGGMTLPVVGIVLLIGLFGLARSDLTLDVEFRWAPVLDVQHYPGRDLAERLVLVEVDDRRFALRTGDRLLRVTKGERVCVKHSTLLLRRWVRRSLALAPYCRHAGLRVS